MGRQLPSIETLAKIAAKLNVDLKDCFEFAHHAAKPDELIKLIEGYAKEAGEDSLRLLVKIARAIVK